MGAVFVSDVEIWLASVMVTISPFVVVVAIVVVDWLVCVVVELIWLLGVIVTKFRCNANWAAISFVFSLCRIGTRLMNFFFVFVSVFLALAIIWYWMEAAFDGCWLKSTQNVNGEISSQKSRLIFLSCLLLLFAEMFHSIQKSKATTGKEKKQHHNKKKLIFRENVERTNS